MSTPQYILKLFKVGANPENAGELFIINADGSIVFRQWQTGGMIDTPQGTATFVHTAEVDVASSLAELLNVSAGTGGSGLTVLAEGDLFPNLSKVMIDGAGPLKVTRYDARAMPAGLSIPDVIEVPPGYVALRFELDQSMISISQEQVSGLVSRLTAIENGGGGGVDTGRELSFLAYWSEVLAAFPEGSRQRTSAPYLPIASVPLDTNAIRRIMYSGDSYLNDASMSGQLFFDEHAQWDSESNSYIGLYRDYMGNTWTQAAIDAAGGTEVFLVQQYAMGNGAIPPEALTEIINSGEYWSTGSEYIVTGSGPYSGMYIDRDELYTQNVTYSGIFKDKLVLPAEINQDEYYSGFTKPIDGITLVVMNPDFTGDIVLPYGGTVKNGFKIRVSFPQGTITSQVSFIESDTGNAVSTITVDHTHPPYIDIIWTETTWRVLSAPIASSETVTEAQTFAFRLESYSTYYNEVGELIEGDVPDNVLVIERPSETNAYRETLNLVSRGRKYERYLIDATRAMQVINLNGIHPFGDDSDINGTSGIVPGTRFDFVFNCPERSQPDDIYIYGHMLENVVISQQLGNNGLLSIIWSGERWIILTEPVYDDTGISNPGTDPGFSLINAKNYSLQDWATVLPLEFAASHEIALVSNDISYSSSGGGYNYGYSGYSGGGASTFTEGGDAVYGENNGNAITGGVHFEPVVDGWYTVAFNIDVSGNEATRDAYLTVTDSRDDYPVCLKHEHLFSLGTGAIKISTGKLWLLGGVAYRMELTMNGNSTHTFVYQQSMAITHHSTDALPITPPLYVAKPEIQGSPARLPWISLYTDGQVMCGGIPYSYYIELQGDDKPYVTGDNGLQTLNYRNSNGTFLHELVTDYASTSTKLPYRRRTLSYMTTEMPLDDMVELDLTLTVRGLFTKPNTLSLPIQLFPGNRLIPGAKYPAPDVLNYDYFKKDSPTVISADKSKSYTLVNKWDWEGNYSLNMRFFGVAERDIASGVSTMLVTTDNDAGWPNQVDSAYRVHGASLVLHGRKLFALFEGTTMNIWSVKCLDLDTNVWSLIDWWRVPVPSIGTWTQDWYSAPTLGLKDGILVYHGSGKMGSFLDPAQTDAPAPLFGLYDINAGTIIARPLAHGRGITAIYGVGLSASTPGVDSGNVWVIFESSTLGGLVLGLFSQTSTLLRHFMLWDVTSSRDYYFWCPGRNSMINCKTLKQLSLDIRASDMYGREWNELPIIESDFDAAEFVNPGCRLTQVSDTIIGIQCQTDASPGYSLVEFS